MDLPVGSRTNISNQNQITFCGSDVNLRLEYLNINYAKVYIWVWSGAQNKTLGEPNATLEKNLVSVGDKYIDFEVSDIIKSFLISPPDASNTDQPTFAYNEIGNPTVTGQGVFWQVIADVTTPTETTRYNFNTQFATLGYNKKYNNFTGTPLPFYNPKIHNYISQSIKLDTTVATANTANMFLVTEIVPTDANSRCSRDPYLIAYVNRKGMFEMFTPNGKCTSMLKIDSDVSNRAFRDATNINHDLQHSKAKTNISVLESFMINTGSLDESMVDIIEQIILSPKVYLVRFKGDLQTSEDVGVTVDSTIITVDTLTVTVDSTTVGIDDVGHYKTFQQIPVIVTDSDFGYKTRLNNKTDINYTLKLDETNNLIN